MARSPHAGAEGHQALRARQGAEKDDHRRLRLHLRHDERLRHSRHHALHL